MSNSFRSHCGLPGLSVHGIFPGKTTGVSCHFLLQEIFPTQGLNQVSHIVGRHFIVSATREVPQPPALGTDALSIRLLGHHPLSMYLFLFFLVQSIQRHMPPSVFFFQMFKYIRKLIKSGFPKALLPEIPSPFHK